MKTKEEAERGFDQLWTIVLASGRSIYDKWWLRQRNLPWER